MTRTPHRTLIGALSLLVLLGVALAAGCSSTPSTTTPTSAPTAVGTASAVATPSAAASVASSGSGAVVAAVPADRLEPFIPAAIGAWKLDGQVQTFSMKDGEGHDYTWVSGEYAKDGSDDAGANLMIMDSAVAKTPYREQWSSFQSVQTNDGWWKSVTVEGQPSWKSFSKDTNSYGQWVLVGDRYIVIATVDGGTEADLDAIVDAMDFAGLAGVR
jgi:hypothetical protein